MELCLGIGCFAQQHLPNYNNILTVNIAIYLSNSSPVRVLLPTRDSYSVSASNGEGKVHSGDNSGSTRLLAELEVRGKRGSTERTRSFLLLLCHQTPPPLPPPSSPIPTPSLIFQLEGFIFVFTPKAQADRHGFGSPARARFCVM